MKDKKTAIKEFRKKFVEIYEPPAHDNTWINLEDAEQFISKVWDEAYEVGFDEGYKDAENFYADDVTKP